MSEMHLLALLTDMQERYRYPTGYKQPPYTYGNSIDRWGDEDDSQDVDIKCVQSQKSDDVQHPFIVVTNEKGTLLDPQEPSCGTKKERTIGVGIDLREKTFSVGFVNDDGRPELIPNEYGQLYHMANVRFLGDSHRAHICFSAANKDNGTKHDGYEPKSLVDLSKLQNNDTYKAYPKGRCIGLHDAVSGKTATEVETDIIAVLMQHAVDLVEAHTGKRVSFINVTYPKKILKYGPRGQLFLKGTIFDTRREKAIRMAAVARLPESIRVDDSTEILALMAGHISFFESHLQPNPDVPEGDPVFLSQMMLMYNLRDSSEDLVVMRYTKGYHGSYHLDFMAGYLPNDGNIHEKFSQYLRKFILDRFNLGVGASGNDRSHKDTIKQEISALFDVTTETRLGDENHKLTFQIADDSYVTITAKDYMECKMKFMKERLGESVPRVLEDAVLVDNSTIDHLIVADASSFQTVSTVVLENIVFGRRSHKKAVSEVDPLKTIALGIASWSG